VQKTTHKHVVTVSERVDEFEITATASQTADRGTDGQGWWIARYRVDSPNEEGTLVRIWDTFMTANAALLAALAEARNWVTECRSRPGAADGTSSSDWQRRT
jgi:hypothetical protein